VLTLLTGFLILAFVMVGIAAVVAFALVIRGVFWLLFLPFKVLGWALSAVLALGGALLTVVLVSVLFIAVAVPLLPLVCVAFVVWVFLRLMKRPATT
jgi:hypothetical protein